jgi:hypothetical protein
MTPLAADGCWHPPWALRGVGTRHVNDHATHSDHAATDDSPGHVFADTKAHPDRVANA